MRAGMADGRGRRAEVQVVLWMRPKRRAALIWRLLAGRVGRGPVSLIRSQGQGAGGAGTPESPGSDPATPLPNKQPLSPLRCAAAPQHSSALVGTLPTTLPYRPGMLRDELRALQHASSWHALVVLTARHGRRARLLLPQDGRLFLSSPCLQPRGRLCETWAD
jgi:hypothetical protein